MEFPDIPGVPEVCCLIFILWALLVFAWARVCIHRWETATERALCRDLAHSAAKRYRIRKRDKGD